MKTQYFWCHLTKANEWLICEKHGNGYYGWGSHWSEFQFDEIIGPLVEPNNENLK